MSTAPTRQSVQESHHNGDAAAYERLREMLVGPEQKRLEELQHRIDDRQLRADDVSAVVAEAIALRIQRDRKLQQIFNPLVEEAVRVSVARDPSILANALFPVIGEAVRKSVAHALRALVESINQTLERRFSLQALKWRMEAFRTGRSFGEIVLMRSVRYRVEEIFVIHRESGLLLQHVSRSDQVIRDSELVSGMLTAIQDFVRDSFKSAENRDIDTIELGEFKLWVQHGPVAILAAVISGTPPPELRNVLQRTLEKFHRDYGPVVMRTTSYASALTEARPLLMSCLLGQQSEKHAKRVKIAWATAAATALVLIAVMGFFSIRAQRRWDNLVERLRSEPGIVLTEAEQQSGRYRLAGLRDPLATDPQKLIAAAKLDPAKITTRWEPYASEDARFTTIRRFLAEKSALEQQVVRFALESAELTNAQLARVDDVASRAIAVQQFGNAVGQSVIIEIRGHTDRSGTERLNAALSRERAEAVINALVARGLSKKALRVVAMGSRAPVQRANNAYVAELNRAVTLRVVAASEAGK